jgi:heptaprenyl diphosphate synthase
MPTEMLSVDLGATLSVVDDWISTYITKPHSEIGRSGPVCPFVEPSRRAGSLETTVRLAGSTPSLPLLTEVVRCSLDEFETISWKTRNPHVRALLVVLADLPGHCLNLLDQAHALVKPESVARGLMIGQFHVDCTEKAARNPQFEVSRSPVPLLAVRLMAMHDVLFLGGRREWFEEFHSRFSRKFRKSSKRIDPLLYELFLKACTEYGIPP